MDRNNNGIPDSIEIGYWGSVVIRGLVIIWAAGVMTFGYMNKEFSYDAAFIASVFSSTLASFGVEVVAKNNKDTKRIDK